MRSSRDRSIRSGGAFESRTNGAVAPWSRRSRWSRSDSVVGTLFGTVVADIAPGGLRLGFACRAIAAVGRNHGRMRHRVDAAPRGPSGRFPPPNPCVLGMSRPPTLSLRPSHLTFIPLFLMWAGYLPGFLRESRGSVRPARDPTARGVHGRTSDCGCGCLRTLGFGETSFASARCTRRGGKSVPSAWRRSGSCTCRPRRGR